MKVHRVSMLVSGLILAALLFAPLVGCDQHRRYSRSSRYEDSRNAEYQRQLAADPWGRNHEEQRRRDRERAYDRRNY